MLEPIEEIVVDILVQHVIRHRESELPNALLQLFKCQIQALQPVFTQIKQMANEQRNRLERYPSYFPPLCDVGKYHKRTLLQVLPGGS